MNRGLLCFLEERIFFKVSSFVMGYAILGDLSRVLYAPIIPCLYRIF